LLIRNNPQISLLIADLLRTPSEVDIILLNITIGLPEGIKDSTRCSNTVPINAIQIINNPIKVFLFFILLRKKYKLYWK